MSKLFYFIIYLTTNLTGVFSAYLIIHYSLIHKHLSANFRVLAFGLYYAFSSLAFLALNSRSVNVAVNLFCLFGVTWLYRASLGKRLLVVISVYLGASLSEDATALLLSWIYDVKLSQIVGNSLFAIMGMVFSKLIFLAIAQLWAFRINRGSDKRRENMPAYWPAFFLVPLGSTYVLHAMFVNLFEHKIQVTVSYAFAIAVLLGINCLVFYLDHRAIQFERIRFEQEEMLRASRKEMEQVELTRSFQDNIRELKHDMKNHNAMLISLAEENNTVEILRYLHGLEEKIGASIDTNNSKNPVINAILNRWLYQMQQEQISYSLSVSIPPKIEVDNPDMSCILGNLLENAIEASKHVPKEKRNIKINMTCDRGMLFIFITNNFLKSTIQSKGEELISTKPQEGGHGLGLRSVKRTVIKYQGVFDYAVQSEKPDDDLCIFKVKVQLYLTKQ